jgi:hypothetical protein
MGVNTSRKRGYENHSIPNWKRSYVDNVRSHNLVPRCPHSNINDYQRLVAVIAPRGFLNRWMPPSVETWSKYDQYNECEEKCPYDLPIRQIISEY